MKIFLVLAALFVSFTQAAHARSMHPARGHGHVGYREAACHRGYNCRGTVLFRIPGDTAIAESCLAAGGNSISAPAKNLCYNITAPGVAPTPKRSSCLPPGGACYESECSCCNGLTILIGNSCR